MNITTDNCQIQTVKTWVSLVEEYVKSGRRSSKRTQNEYRKIVTKAMTALGVDDISELTPSHFTAYRGALVKAMNASDDDGAKLSASTVATRLTAFSGFLNYARVSSRSNMPADAIHLLLESPSVNVVRPYEVASADEIDRLVAACTSARDNVPLSDRASQQGDRLNPSRVRQVFIAARDSAGLAKQISAHSLRHTAALRWLVKGADVMSVSKLLGYSKLEVTMRY